MDNIKSIISNNEGQRNYNFLPPSVIPATYIKGKKGNTPITMEGIQYPMIALDKYGVTFQQPDQRKPGQQQPGQEQALTYNYKSKGVLEFPYMPGSIKKDEEMPTAQRGGSQGDQMQQLIIAYAQIKSQQEGREVSPEEIMRQLQQLSPKEQNDALSAIAEQVQQVMAQQQQQEQQMAMQQQGAGPGQQQAMMGQEGQEEMMDQEQGMMGQGMMNYGGEPCIECFDNYNPSPQAQNLNWFYKKEGGPFSAANTYPTDWASYSGNQYAKGGTAFPAAVRLQDWFGGDKSFMFAKGGNTSDQWGGQSDIHRAYKMMKEGGFAMNPKKKKGGKFNHLDEFHKYLEKGGGLTKYQYDNSVVDESDYDPEFNKVIDWMMNYERQGSAQGPKGAKGYVGGGNDWGTNNPNYADREKAKRYFYDNYWSQVKNLPPGLRTRALQLAVNTGDAYGEMLVAAGKMSVADRMKAIREAEAKGLTGLEKAQYVYNKRMKENKKEIDTLPDIYEADPVKYFTALNDEQRRYYTEGLNDGNNPDKMKDFHVGYYEGVAPFANDYYSVSTSPEGKITTSSPNRYEWENSSGERYEYLPLRKLQDWARDQGQDPEGISRKQLETSYKNWRNKQASDFENQSTSQPATTNTQAPATTNQPAPNTTTSTNSDEARRYVEGIGWVSPAFENEYCIDEKCSNLQGYFGTDKTEEEWKDYINKYQKEIEPNYSYDYTKDHSPIYLTNPETGEKTDIDINRYMQEGEFISDMIARNDLIENRLSKELGEAQKSGNTAEINRIQKELMDIQHQGHTISGEGLGIYPDWKARKNETYDYFSNPQNQPSTYLNGVSSPYGVALANTPTANASQPPVNTNQPAPNTTAPNNAPVATGTSNPINVNIPGNDKINQEDYNAYTSYGDAGTPNAYDDSTNLQGYNSRFETPGFNPFAYRNADKAERHWQRGEQENNHRGKGWREFRQMKQEEDIAQMQADKDFNSGAYRNQNRALRQYDNGFANSGKGWKEYNAAKNQTPITSNNKTSSVPGKVNQYVGNLPTSKDLGVTFWGNKNIKKIKGTPNRPIPNIAWNTPGNAYMQGAMNSKLFGTSGLGLALSTLTGAINPNNPMLGEDSTFKAKYRKDGSLRKVKGSSSDVNSFFNPNVGTTTTNNTSTTTSTPTTTSPYNIANQNYLNKQNEINQKIAGFDPTASDYFSKVSGAQKEMDDLDTKFSTWAQGPTYRRGGAYHYLPMALMGMPDPFDAGNGSIDDLNKMNSSSAQDWNAYAIKENDPSRFDYTSNQPSAQGDSNVKVKTTDKGAWWQPNQKRTKAMTALLASGNAALDAKRARNKEDQYATMQENMTAMSNPSNFAGSATQTQFNSPGAPVNDLQKIYPNGPGASIATNANYGMPQLYNNNNLRSTRDGGSIYDRYEDGGEYDLTDDEIQEILAAGGSIEYI
jgi:hypothetical protein